MKRKNIYKDFDIFTRAQLGSKDVDPCYIILKDLAKKFKFEPVWFSFLFGSFDNEVSAFRIAKEMPTAGSWNEKEFIKLRKEIKGFGGRRRGTGTVPEYQAKTFNKVKYFLKNDLFNFKDNITLRKQIESEIPLFGETQAFKVSEIIYQVTGWEKIKLFDMGLEKKDLNAHWGVPGGMNLLWGKGNYDESIIESWEGFAYLVSEYYGVDKLRIESCICDFSKMVRGRYFVGHDISYYFKFKPFLGEYFAEMMQKYFDKRLWNKDELQNQNKKVYLNTGEIINKEFGDIFPIVDIELLIKLTKEFYKIKN